MDLETKGRTYWLTFNNQTYAAADGDIDLWEIRPADDKPVYLSRVTLEKTTDLGDAELEGLRLEVIVGHTTVGSGGASYIGPSVGRQNTSDTDPGFGSARMNDVVATTGTTYSVLARGWPYPIFDHVWNIDTRPLITHADTMFVVRAHTTVADDISITGTLELIEIG